MKKRPSTLQEPSSPAQDGAAQALLAQAVEQNREVIFIANRDGVLEYVNAAFETVTGYAAQEALGQPLDLFLEKTTQRAHRQWLETVLSGKPVRTEAVGRKKNGERFHFEQAISPHKDSNGRVAHLVFVGRDISERKRAEQESGLLLEITRVIAEAENSDSALGCGLRVFCEFAGWDFSQFWFLSTDGKKLELGKAHYCAKKELEIFRKASEKFDFAPGIGLPGRIWNSGKAAWIADVTADPNFPRALHAKDAGIKTGVGVPILAGERVVAVVEFFARAARQEDARLVPLVSAVAAQLGAVYQRKRTQDEIVGLHEDLERSAAVIEIRLRESDALAKIARSLSETERVGLQTVLQLIAVSAQELIPAAQKAVIHLWDEEEQTLTAQAVIGYENAASSQLKMRHNEGVAGLVIASGETVNIANIEQDRRFIFNEAAPTFRSLMVAPVQSGDRRLGTISVQSDMMGAFSDDDSRLLRILGTQAAAAIENAHLLETIQRRLKEMDALYRITRELAASLEADQLMQEVVDLLQALFGYYHVSIFVVEPASGQLVMKRGSGDRGVLLKNTRLPGGAGIIGHVAETGEAFFTNNVEDVVFFVPHPLLTETRSELAMPIKVNDRVLGVLDIQQSWPHRLHQHDLQLISTVAEQLAISLQKAELYSNLQDSLNVEKSMRMQLIQSERLALVGRLLASVSHELNNPLQAIQNALFLIKDDEGMSAQSRQDLQIVLSETERMAGLIERLRASYRPTQLDEFQPVQINAIVEDVYALLATHLRHKNVALEFHPDPNLPLVPGLPDQLRQVTLNLLMNGVDAISADGRLIVSTEVVENKEVLISVSDSGPGIDPVLLPRIFDAFVTSKERGTGLGLTITYDIVHRHHGRISAENNPNGGATFKIWLPVYQSEQI